MNQTKNRRKLLLIPCGCGIVGDGLYAIPFSGEFLPIGRIFQGLCQVAQPVMIEETARVYSNDETNAKVSNVAVMEFHSIDQFLG